MLRWIAAIALAVSVAGASARAAEPFQPTRFTAQDEGSGPDVILIPGVATSRAEFDDLARRLGGRYRLHRIQVAGFAGAPAAANGQGPVVDPLVEELHRYIVSRGLRRPAIVGHSLGGLIGLLLAERHPEDLGRLMIIDALPFYPVILSPSITVAQVQPMAARLRDGVIAATPAQFATSEAQTAQRLSKTPAGQALVAGWGSTSDQGVAARATYDDMTTDARPGLASVQLPVTVLYAFDAAMGPQAAVDGLYQGQYAALPHKTLQRIDGSFHFIPLDQPAAFVAAVLAFLQPQA
jgi:pimeloyl-ACP methyl ester carboxylesterase